MKFVFRMLDDKKHSSHWIAVIWGPFGPKRQSWYAKDMRPLFLRDWWFKFIGYTGPR